MDKRIKWAFIHFGIFVFLFLFTYSGISLGDVNRVIMLWLVLSPIFGAVSALQGEGKKQKWIIFFLNIIALIGILYLYSNG